MRLSLNSINCALFIVYVLIAVPLWGAYFHPTSHASHNFIKNYVESLRRQSSARAQILKINLLMPPHYGMLRAFNSSPDGQDPDSLINYVRYYNALSDFLPVPYSADAHAMLGFAYYHQNKMEEALKSYTRSLEINPAFVWTYYNLALIHFRAGNYEQAARLVVQMAALNPEISARMLTTSKIYSDILREEPGIDLSKNLLSTYSDAFRILIISQYRIQNLEEVLNTARYAAQSGFQPIEVFQYYAALATGSEVERAKADAFMSTYPEDPKVKVLKGDDLDARFF